MEPRPDDRPSEIKRDLEAALHTRKELGAEYESELVDSFLSRIDARLDARVEQQVAERMSQYGPAAYGTGRPERAERRRGFSSGGKLPIVSLVFAVPLTAIASGNPGSGIMGLLVCWAGIVGVNFAAVLAERRERQERREEKRPGVARSEWA